MRFSRLLFLLAVVTFTAAGPSHVQVSGSHSVGEMRVRPGPQAPPSARETWYALGPPAPSAVDSPSRRESIAWSHDGELRHDHGAAMLAVAGVTALLTALTVVATVWRIQGRSRQQLADCTIVAREVALAVDALPSVAGHVAILDGDGSILAVNDAWNTFATSNGVHDLTAIGPGTSYLDVCARAVRVGAPGAAAAREGIEAVCKGRRAGFELEYHSDGPLESAWFQMTVRPLRGEQGGAVVSHCNITALKRTEIAVRARDLSMLVDALPVGVKIVDANGLGRHFNPAWLRMTVRK